METPAPWNLTGRGFILLYRFSETFIRESCFLPDEWKELKWSGMGYVMLVDYQTSPIGPYKELLVIPGKAHLGGTRLSTISKIYVNEPFSMINGRDNWGIPKEMTDISWTQDGKEHIIEIGGYGPWMEMILEPGSMPFPLDTRLLPIHLYQELDNKIFRVSPHGKGTGHFALLKDLRVDPVFFPDLNSVEPLVAMYVDPFKMTFPVPEIEPIVSGR